MPYGPRNQRERDRGSEFQNRIGIEHAWPCSGIGIERVSSLRGMKTDCEDPIGLTAVLLDVVSIVSGG